MATWSASYTQTERGDGMRNTLRFALKDKDAAFQDRITFGRRILFDALQIQPEEIYCLQQSITNKYYDVTLTTKDTAEEARRKAHLTSNEELKRYMVTPLYRSDYSILTVHMYNPWVSEETIRCFLGRHVKVLPGVRIIKDGLGLWTGKRQFRVKMEEDPNSEDGYRHPPAVFSIGADRGFLIYAGQPLVCRRCGGKGHEAANCNQVRCRNCNETGHSTRDCTVLKRCHLCESEEHMARDCTKPRSYAAVVVGPVGQEKETGHDKLGTPLLMQETPAGERNEADEEEEVSERMIEVPLLDTEDRNKEGSFATSEDMTEQPWREVRKAGRKKAKRRKRQVSATPPEDSNEEKLETAPFGVEGERRAPKGTQTECTHTPLSSTISENDSDDGSENESNAESSLIRTLFSQESLGK